MSPPPADLVPPARLVAEVVRGVQDDELHRPTPCLGTPLEELLGLAGRDPGWAGS